jgi:hypothetical protein
VEGRRVDQRHRPGIGEASWLDSRDEGGSFTIVVYAESLREVEQTAKARYLKSTVRIAFPIEPEWFFAGAPHTGARRSRGDGRADGPDKAVVTWPTNYAR